MTKAVQQKRRCFDGKHSRIRRELTQQKILNDLKKKDVQNFFSLKSIIFHQKSAVLDIWVKKFSLSCNDFFQLIEIADQF